MTGFPEPTHLARPATYTDGILGVVAGPETEEASAGEGVANGEGVDDEEVRAPRKALQPYIPSKAEVDDHDPLHLTYRSWCEQSIFGRGLNTQHRSTGEPVEDVTWNTDDCFVGGRLDDNMLDNESNDDKKISKPAILVTYDDLGAPDKQEGTHRRCGQVVQGST